MVNIIDRWCILLKNLNNSFNFLIFFIERKIIFDLFLNVIKNRKNMLK